MVRHEYKQRRETKKNWIYYADEEVKDQISQQLEPIFFKNNVQSKISNSLAKVYLFITSCFKVRNFYN